MLTVTNVIAAFRRRYPGCDTTTAGLLFDKAYKRLLDKAGFRTRDVTFSSLVDGTREYDWAEADLRVYFATYYVDADNFSILTPTDEDNLRDVNPAWNADDSDTGTPTSFYIASRVDATSNKTGKLVIGFNPIPDTTTSAGYPKVVCHCESHASISGNTEIPYSVLDEGYFVASMSEQWAREEDIAKVPIWRQERIEEETIQLEHMKMLSVNSEPTKILPPTGFFSSVPV